MKGLRQNEWNFLEETSIKKSRFQFGEQGDQKKIN
jgi:hypothetical protein